jgi:hypothetical protein
VTRDEYIRQCLSIDYPRLDIRCGGAYATPWEFRPKPVVLGWLDDDGVIHEFAPREESA